MKMIGNDLKLIRNLTTIGIHNQNNGISPPFGSIIMIKICTQLKNKTLIGTLKWFIMVFLLSFKMKWAQLI